MKSTLQPEFSNWLNLYDKKISHNHMIDENTSDSRDNDRPTLENAKENPRLNAKIDCFQQDVKSHSKCKICSAKHESQSKHPPSNRYHSCTLYEVVVNYVKSDGVSAKVIYRTIRTDSTSFTNPR